MSHATLAHALRVSNCCSQIHVIIESTTTLINHHFAPAYLLGTTRLSFIRLRGLELSIYLRSVSSKSGWKAVTETGVQLPSKNDLHISSHHYCINHVILRRDLSNLVWYYGHFFIPIIFIFPCSEGDHLLYIYHHLSQ